MSTGDEQIDRRSDRLLKRAGMIMESLGEAVWMIDDHIKDPRDSATYIKEVRLRVRYDDEGDIQVVVKRDGEEGQQVAFHAGETLAEALMGLSSRLRNGNMKWREDKPYGSRNDSGK